MTESEVERIVVRFMGDNTSYVRAAQGAAKATQGMTHEQKQGKDAMVSFGAGIDSLGAKVSNMAGQFRAMAALGSPWEQATRGVGLAAEAERMETNLATMLGSVTKAKMLMTEMQVFAAKTPMELPGISAAANLLIQYQTPVEEIIPLMKQLGDVALGDSAKFQRIALAFGQMTAAGKTTREELGQMREAGFNPTQAIAEVMGITMAELNDKFERGQVPLSAFRQALTKVTGEGGKFYNGMENGARTISGLWSTMNDDIGAFQRTIGFLAIEELKLRDIVKGVSSAAQSATEMLQNMNPAVKAVTIWVGLLAASFGSLIIVWKVATIMVGMAIGTTRNFVGSVVWATGATWEWAKSLLGLSAAARIANANAMMLGLGIEKSTVGIKAMTAATVAAKLAMAAMIIYGVFELSMALPPYQEHLRAVNAELAQHTELLRQATAAAQSAEAPNLGETAGIGFIEAQVNEAAPGADRAEASKRGLEQLSAAMELYAESAAGARAKSAELSGSVMGIMNALMPGKSRIEGQIEMAEESAKHFDDLVKQTQDSIAKMRETQRRATGVAIDPILVKQGADFIKNLEKQQYALTHTATEAALYDLVLAKVPQTAINAARSIMDMNDALKKEKELHDAIASATTSAEHAMATYGMTASQVTLYDFAVKGATESQLANIRGIMAMNAELDKQKSIMDEGRRVIEQYATPAESYMKEMAHLNTLLSAGAIDQEMYNRAVDATTKKLNESGEAAKQAAQAVMQLDGALRGSAEAQARINAYKEAIRTPGMSPAGAGAGNAAGIGNRQGDMRPQEQNVAARERDPAVIALMDLVRIARGFANKQGIAIDGARLGDR